MKSKRDKKIVKALGKKGLFISPLVNGTVLLFSLLIIAGLVYFLFYYSTDMRELQITEKSHYIKADITLNNILRTPITLPESSTTGAAIGIGTKEITIADLIQIMAVEQDSDKKKEYNKILEERVDPILNAVYGSGTGTWMLYAEFADQIVGDKVVEPWRTTLGLRIIGVVAEMPSSNGKIIRVKMNVKIS